MPHIVKQTQDEATRALVKARARDKLMSDMRRAERWVMLNEFVALLAFLCLMAMVLIGLALI